MMNIESIRAICNINNEFKLFCENFMILETVFKKHIYCGMIHEIRSILIIPWCQKDYKFDEVFDVFIKLYDPEIQELIDHIYNTYIIPNEEAFDVKKIPYKEYFLKSNFGEILLKRKIFDAMVFELKGALNDANIEDVNEFLQDNDNSIRNATNDMYDAYANDPTDLRELWSPELDWYREFLYDYVDVPNIDN